MGSSVIRATERKTTVGLLHLPADLQKSGSLNNDRPFDKSSTRVSGTQQREIADVRDKIHGLWKALASRGLNTDERRLLRDHLGICQGRLKLLLTHHPVRPLASYATGVS